MSEGRKANNRLPHRARFRITRSPRTQVPAGFYDTAMTAGQRQFQMKQIKWRAFLRKARRGGLAAFS
jgi:hypothetical protein